MEKSDLIGAIFAAFEEGAASIKISEEFLFWFLVL